jgi:hypothetical protein
MAPPPFPSIVIPAKAGIHTLRRPRLTARFARMDPRLRGDDGCGAASACLASGITRYNHDAFVI